MKKIRIFNQETGEHVINEFCNKVVIKRICDPVRCPQHNTSQCKRCEDQITLAIEMAQILYDGGGLYDADTIKVGNRTLKLHKHISH